MAKKEAKKAAKKVAVKKVAAKTAKKAAATPVSVNNVSASALAEIRQSLIDSHGAVPSNKIQLALGNIERAIELIAWDTSSKTK